VTEWAEEVERVKKEWQKREGEKRSWLRMSEVE
jgi:hypothetical protein